MKTILACLGAVALGGILITLFAYGMMLFLEKLFIWTFFDDEDD